VRGVICALAMWAALAAPAAAADAARLTIFDIPLGAAASTLPPAEEFGVFACGNDGGPPGAAIAGWTDYAKCPADSQGLHEVYFEYDDEAEYAARARGDYRAGWQAGTAIDAFPVITSALFDDAGRVEALRIVTDPRPEQRKDAFLHLRPRSEHYLLGLYLLDQFGMSAADCHDEPPGAGEGAVLGMLVKQDCTATRQGQTVTIASRLYRRPGEADVDPATGLRTEGAFVSETRAEITAAANTDTPPRPAPVRP
jgi:hypothetical protein